MPHTLTPHPFTLADQADVADFDCGSNPWEVSVADWIKTQRVFNSMNRGTSVWLYKLTSGDIVGYGSIGTTRWQWPSGEVPSNLDVVIIPSLAIRKKYQGKPSPKAGVRYSTQIIDHLLSEAYKLPPDYIVLEVHCQNARAISLYESYSFTMSRRAEIKHFGGVDHVYRRMYLKKS